MKNFIIILSLLLAFTVNVFAQNVSFTASAPKVVSANEQFNVTFSVNAKGTNFTPPKLDNFKVVFGRPRLGFCGPAGFGRAFFLGPFRFRVDKFIIAGPGLVRIFKAKKKIHSGLRPGRFVSCPST